MRLVRENEGWPRGAQHAGDQLQTGYLVSLSSLKVTQGTAMGETLNSPENLYLGDAVKLQGGATNLPVTFDDRGAQGVTIVFDNADIGAQVTNALVATTATFMTEFGRVVNARVLHELEHFHGEAFALLEECMAPSVEHILIDETPRANP